MSELMVFLEVHHQGLWWLAVFVIFAWMSRGEK